MGDRDLENIISSIGQEEMQVAQKQAQIERLKQLILKQKNEMGEQQKLVDELQGRINNMYDLPADVEALKRMVGEMRAELNQKDAQMEIAYGTVAQQEGQLKNQQMQMDSFNQNLNIYITQVGELKTKLIEQKGVMAAKDREIHELQIAKNRNQDSVQNMEEEFAKRVQGRLRQFMDTEDDYKARIEKMEEDFEERMKDIRSQSTSTKDDYVARIAKMELDYRDKLKQSQDEIRELQSKVHQLEMDNSKFTSEIAEIDDIKENYDKTIAGLREETQEGKKRNEERVLQLKDEHFKEKSENIAKIDSLESELMEFKLKIQESDKTTTLAENRLKELQSKQEDLVERYENLVKVKDDLEAKYKEFRDGNQDLIDFKEENVDKVENFDGLLKLFEEETLFKTFLLVRDVGEMSLELLKGALGVPTVTTKKYVDQFVKVGLFEHLENGKVKLNHPF
ncbi:MAG: hypothetical protein ACTSRK_03145 [Promethearchaeota archaeon]